MIDTRIIGYIFLVYSLLLGLQLSTPGVTQVCKFDPYKKKQTNKQTNKQTKTKTKNKKKIISLSQFWLKS